MREFEELRINNKVVYKPQDKQKVFHNAILNRDENGYRDFLYGGAAKGGKSHALRWEAHRNCLEYPNLRGLLIRSSFPELERTHLSRLMYDLPLEVASYNGQRHALRYSNGSTLEFGYGDKREDFSQYLSAEYDFILIDELTTIPFVFSYLLRSRLAGSRKDFIPFWACGTNPGDKAHCVPFGDVLTTNGWKPIQDLNVGEMIYSVEKDGKLVEKPVTKTFQYQYDGELVNIDVRGLKIIATSNHRVAQIIGTKSNRGKKNFNLVEINKLPGQVEILRCVEYVGGNIGGEFVVPEVKTRATRGNIKKQPQKLSMSNFCKLLGWFLSEGTASIKKGYKRFGIAQEKLVYRFEIENLLDSCGFRYHKGKSEFIISSPEWANYFYQFGKCRDKFIPLWVKNLNKIHLKELFETMMNGDGHWYNKKLSGDYYTISKQLADDFQEICIKLGYLTNIKVRQDKNRIGVRYIVHFRNTSSCGTQVTTGNHIYNVSTKSKRKSKIKREYFAGKVYCIGVKDTESFIIRQNGSAWVSGNSDVKAYFVTKSPDKELYPSYKESEVFFLPATVYDNLILLNRDPEVLKRLQQLSPRDQQKFLYGNWDIFEGQFFDNFLYDVHVIQRENYLAHDTILSHFNVQGSIDYGNVTYVPLGLKDHNGNVVIFDEWMDKGSTRPTKIKELYRFLDSRGMINIDLTADTNMWIPDAFDVEDTNVPAHDFEEAGFNLYPVSKSGKGIKNRSYRINCNDTIRGALHWVMKDGEMIVHPKLKIYSRCKHLISCISSLIGDPNDPDDIADGQFDHPYDGLKYLYMNFMTPAKPRDEDNYQWLRQARLRKAKQLSQQTTVLSE